MEKISNSQHRLVIMYDYDGTLAPGNIQEPFLIPKIMPSCKGNTQLFWEETKNIYQGQTLDKVLVYLQHILDLAKESNIALTRKFLKICGSYSKPFSGLETWFERINSFAKAHKITVEHYVISAGNKEIIEGSPIAKYFNGIYACRYAFDEHGVAKGIGEVVNKDTKLPYIESLRLSMQQKLTQDAGGRILENDKLPYQYMVYLGDGETDIPAMELLSAHGGYPFAIYADTPYGQQNASGYKARGSVCNYFNCKNAYHKNSKLEKRIFAIILRMEQLLTTNTQMQLTIFDTAIDIPDKELKQVNSFVIPTPSKKKVITSKD
jgi:2-hydroxy-3-keto-5-methylthiopentenyl-1-phosphate phosphatase